MGIKHGFFKLSDETPEAPLPVLSKLEEKPQSAPVPAQANSAPAPVNPRGGRRPALVLTPEQQAELIRQVRAANGNNAQNGIVNGDNVSPSSSSSSSSNASHHNSGRRPS